MENKFSLDGKTAIVTGGGGILGYEFCKTLALSGAKVAVVDCCMDAAITCVSSIKKLYPKTKLYPVMCDVSNIDSVEAMLKSITKEFGEIHILHNNAATKTTNLKKFFKKFENYEIDTWKEVMSVNIDGMFLVAQAIGKHMIEHGVCGSIIQTASIYGVVAPDQRIYDGSSYNNVLINTPAVYSVSKAAVLGLTRYLASYWGTKNIRVNSLTPGGVESGQNDVFMNNYSLRVPLRRMAKASEMQGALLFLASEASSYVTGQNIIVDGGLTCW